MSDPKRLEFIKSAECDMGCSCGLIPDPIECKDGRFVFYSDYARLKADVERLTKAGDALENWIAWVCESPVGTAAGVRDAWDAAKEGKQS